MKKKRKIIPERKHRCRDPSAFSHRYVFFRKRLGMCLEKEKKISKGGGLMVAIGTWNSKHTLVNSKLGKIAVSIQKTKRIEIHRYPWKLPANY